VTAPSRAAADREERSIQEVRRWLRAFRRGARLVRPNTDEEREVAALAARMGGIWVAGGEHAEEAGMILLDLAGLGLRESFALSPFTAERFAGRGTSIGECAARVRDLAQRELRVRLVEAPPERRSWLAREVLLVQRDADLARREVALSLVAEDSTRASLLAVLTVANDEQDPLRDEARIELAGWPDPMVDAFLLARFESAAPEWRIPAWRALRAHLRLRPDPPSTTRHAVRELASGLLLGADWREASRGLELLELLPSDRDPALLIEALASWSRRMKKEPGTGGRRISNDLLKRLQELSGRAIALDPDAWREWWQRVEAGEIPLLREGQEGRAASVTEASFFGLRPESDQVWFVLDHSGSMNTAVGTSSRTRYQEALGQLEGYLAKAGPETRFGITLFDGRTRTWREELQWASPENLKAALDWMRSQPPDGATLLHQGVHEVMHIGSDGVLRLERLSVDTVVVLCDGQTSAGPSWVVPFLERYNEVARVVFHGVLLSTVGDGTLEALAEGSGGQLVIWH
jgi:hypothetical protein